MSVPTCPDCQRTTARRCRRSGLVEQIASLAYVYPFRCEVCGLRFHAIRWRTHYARMPRDRRRHERVEITAPIVVDVGGHRVDGVTQTLSLGGCGAMTRAPLQAGDLATLEIACESDGPIVVDAVVASVRPDVMGFAFTRLYAGHARRLATLLADVKPASDARPRFHARVAMPTVHAPVAAPRRTRVAWLATLGLTAISALMLSVL